MRGKGKGATVCWGRKLFSMVALEYGYTGREIAEYIQKDPAIVTRYSKEKEDLKREVERVIKMIGNVNSQA
jgi:hypothetical protein